MKELPALAGGKSTLVGTYFAEQVSSASYDLISVTHADQQRRPATQHVGGGRNGALSAPSSATGGRRRHIQDQAGTKCTVLPALATIDLLLQEDGTGAGSAEGSPAGTSADWKEEQQGGSSKRELREARKAERILRSSARLCRGQGCFQRKRSGDRCGTPTDEDIMRGLTQPMHYFSELRPGGGAGTDDEKPQPVSPPKKQYRRHQTYNEVFRVSLAGTELASLPQRARNPAQPSGGGRPPRKNDSYRLSVSGELAVLPEDPVAEFFRMEEAAMQARSSQPPGGEAAAAADERTSDQRRARLRDMLKNAVYKEDGALSLAKGLRPGPGPAPAQSETADAAAAPAGGDPPGASPVDPALAPGTDGEASNEASAATKRPNDSWSDILDAVQVRQKITPLRREACQFLRIFIFGSVGNEQRKGKEKEKTYYEERGTKQQVKTVYTLWDRIDMDGSGYIDLQEFRNFVEQVVSDGKTERRPSIPGAQKKDGLQMAFLNNGTPEENAKFGAKLCERLGAAFQGRNKTCFVMEDLMRLIWPRAGVPDLKQMKAWCEEFSVNHSRWRVQTPKVLSPAELEALRAVFKHFDKDSSGSVTAEELIQSGLLDKEMAHKYLHETDADGNGELEIHEFCELMCPTGYRANSRAEKGTTGDGQRVLYDKKLGGWRLETNREPVV